MSVKSGLPTFYQENDNDQCPCHNPADDEVITDSTEIHRRSLVRHNSHSLARPNVKKRLPTITQNILKKMLQEKKIYSVYRFFL